MSRRSKAAQAGEYDLRSNMKDKPNAQGTLFSGGERTPESRQPRGYSPERMRDVQSYFGVHEDAARLYGASPREYGDWHQLAQTIARSTVPLNGPVRAPESPADAGWNDKWGPSVRVEKPRSNGAAGEYYQPDPARHQGEELGDGTIRVHPNAVRGSTVIHELGHHADYMREPGSGLRPPGGNFAEDTPEHRGRREAFADNFAQEHARDPGYKRRPSQDYVTTRRTGHAWERSYYPGDEARSKAFNRAYRRERAPRNPNLSGAQFEGHGEPLFAAFLKPREGGGTTARFVDPETLKDL